MAFNADTQKSLDQIAQNGKEFKDGVPGARETLLSSLAQLHSSLLLPAEQVLYLLWGHPSHNAVIRLGSEIGLFEVLAADDGSPKTSKSIAEKTNPRAEDALVGRMLRLLAAMGTVKETDVDTFAPTPFAKSMTQEDFKDTVAFMQDDFNITHLKEPEYFKEIGYKNPTSAEFAPFIYAMNGKGQHFFEYFAKSAPWMGKRFANMMQVWSFDRPKWVEDGYYPVKERLIEGASEDKDEPFLVDVGGGSGHDLAQLLQAFGDAIPGKLILEDRPEIIEIAEKQVDPKIVKISHDFLTEQPIKGARAYYLHSIIQDWGDETCQQILRSIIPALKPGYSKILINDYVIPDRGARWEQTALDWELMASLSARHRTVDEMSTMLDGAGLKIVKIFKHPQSVDSLVEVDLA